MKLSPIGHVNGGYRDTDYNTLMGPGWIYLNHKRALYISEIRGTILHILYREVKLEQ